jgi:hypothetical protein
MKNSRGFNTGVNYNYPDNCTIFMCNIIHKLSIQSSREKKSFNESFHVEEQARLGLKQAQSLLQIFWRFERFEQVLKLMSDKSYERRRPEMFFYKFKEET